MGRLIGVVDETLIAGFGLPEDLDDLNAADILHRRIIQGLGGRHGALVELRASGHHEHIAEHAQRHCCEGSQTHAPVDGKDVDQDDDRDQKIRRKLRHNMGKRRLDGVDTLNQGVFQGAGTLFQNGTQRHPRQLFHAAFPDFPQHGEGRLMAGGGGQRVKQHPPQPERRHDQAAVQIEGEVLHTAHQPLHDADHDKIRGKREGDTDDRQNHAQDILSSVVARLAQHPGHG